MTNDAIAKDPAASLEENLKKALTELLILHLLTRREFYIGELTATLQQESGGALNIVFPYSAVYRLQREGYIVESGKRIAPDGRRRQYLSITEHGHAYYSQLLQTYDRFTGGITAVLKQGEVS
ncbi:MAG: helix-turn-helix transcriptional regulator [Oscillospiraceae bacterium]|nr:helix-turn-helix transcriptional regulator [Oscillospiraceae bacterium]MBQ5711943.1 helix-turn-helix transcriptional regulator [Oscillospiraceae bacterium]